MRLLFDQNFDRRLLPLLTELGHDIQVIALDHPAGMPDPEVLAIAHRDGRVLLTNDNDFGRLAVLDRRPHAGVILLRLGASDLATKLARIRVALAAMIPGTGLLIVVTERRLRIRRT